MYFFFFFFNDTATTEIYTLSLHDALPIYPRLRSRPRTTRTPQAVTAPGTGFPYPTARGCVPGPSVFRPPCVYGPRPVSRPVPPAQPGGGHRPPARSSHARCRGIPANAHRPGRKLKPYLPQLPVCPTIILSYRRGRQAYGCH